MKIENRIEDFEKMINEIGFITGYGHITQFVNGNFSRKKNGNLNLSIELPTGIIKEECKGIPMNNSDYEYIPVLVFVKQEK